MSAATSEVSGQGSAAQGSAGQTRFTLLDGMRGFAALGVLSFHVVVLSIYPYLDSWYLLVDFFFVLSGFVLFPSMPQKIRSFPKDALRFVVKRVFRFWPMLLAVLLFTWAAHTYLIQAENILKPAPTFPDPNFTSELFVQSLLLMHIWVSAAIAMNWSLWSLSAEWFANLIFTPLTALKGFGIWLGIIAGYVMLWYGLNHDQDWIGNSSTFGSGPIREWEALGRAMLGFGLGLLVRKHLAVLTKIRNRWMFVVSLAVAWLLFQSHGFFQDDMVYWTTYFAGPVFALLVLQASQFNPSASGIWGKFLTFMGKMSFGIYAFHVVVSLNYDKFVPEALGSPFPGDEKWTIYLVTKIVMVSFISFVLAYGTNWIFERPLQALGRKIVKAIR